MAGSSPWQENTPAAAALGAAWNGTKPAASRLQLLRNLLWHKRENCWWCGRASIATAQKCLICCYVIFVHMQYFSVKVLAEDLH